MSVDPLSGNFPFFTPYQFAGNDPIRCIDLDGLEGYDVKNALKGKTGTTIAQLGVRSASGDLRFYNEKGFMIYPSSKAYVSLKAAVESQGWKTNGYQVYNESTKTGNQDGYVTSGIWGGGGNRPVNILVSLPIDPTDFSTIYMPETEPIAVGSITLAISLPEPMKEVKLVGPPKFVKFKAPTSGTTTTTTSSLPSSVSPAFIGNSTELLGTYDMETEMAELVKYMKDNPSIQITLIGNTGSEGADTDPTGSTQAIYDTPQDFTDEYGTMHCNDGSCIRTGTKGGLMDARANKVRNYLVGQGIDASRISTARGSHQNGVGNRKVDIKKRE